MDQRSWAGRAVKMDRLVGVPRRKYTQQETSLCVPVGFLIRDVSHKWRQPQGAFLSGFFPSL